MKSFFSRLLGNHVLANLLFLLVLLMGAVSYFTLPRQQDPTVNFNWISIITVLPGASASIVEEKVTQIIEEGLESVKDMKFVSSVSRKNSSSILIRFNDIDSALFDKRVQDVRRILQSKKSELPDSAHDSEIFEVTSSNAFPSALVIVSSARNDEQLRKAARALRRDLERLKSVFRVDATALTDPQINIEFSPEKLSAYRLNIQHLSNSIRQAVRDTAAGDLSIGNRSWLVSVDGVGKDINKLATIPIQTEQGEIPLNVLATISQGRSEASAIVRFDGDPAIMLSVLKKDRANSLQLVQKVDQIINQKNDLSNGSIRYTLADDQTEITRNALRVMESNFLIGLVMVLCVTWIFLGSKIALMTTIGIPFTIAGTLWAISQIGFTLNTSVLLGVVIALGMLVDDAVVVVESIYSRLQKHETPLDATINGIKEVIAPVTTSVLTTIAAFLPLMLLPGILGKFMLVVPLVVTLALLVSLFEAYWLLPSHVLMLRLNFRRLGRIAHIRRRLIDRYRRFYARVLLVVLRYPKTVVLITLMLMVSAGGSVAGGFIKMDFFASDTLRLFYISVKMPSDSSLENTMRTTDSIRQAAEKHLPEGETRSVIAYAGQMFTETEPFFGSQFGQILISLKPKQEGFLSVENVMSAMREDVMGIAGPEETSFLKLAGGPPSGRDVNIKILGDDYANIRKAASALKSFMASNPEYTDISDDDTEGTLGLSLKINYPLARSMNISPAELIRSVQSLVDGVVVTNTLINNELVDVRLRAKATDAPDIVEYMMQQNVVNNRGELTPLRNLLQPVTERVKGNIRHYNFQRAITVEANIKKTMTDTVKANKKLLDYWKGTVAPAFPSLNIDTSGALDDIQESLNAIAALFLFGMVLIYLILGTQFRSYVQPFMVLIAVPLAFIGVVAGLLITQNPLSLYTLYGIVALSGISVNGAIVMTATANGKKDSGMSDVHAIFYAARRRLVPITITSLTTIAGLFSLATGIGGKSLIWGPVATAIVSGLLISAILSLLAVPVFYLLTERLRGAALSLPLHRRFRKRQSLYQKQN